MRYFSAPRREAFEARHIPDVFGKTYAPAEAPELRSDSVIGRTGADLVDLSGQTLAIHPDAGGWAFLTAREADLFARMGAQTRLDDVAPAGPARDAFVGHLYSRGLISVDKRRAVDAAMFAQSPNYQEGHLVELLLSEKCNLSCGYCLAGANQKMPAMNTDIARRAADLAFKMSEARVFGFEFSGGEPFLKFELMRGLVDYIRDHPDRDGRPIYFSVQSNGTLLNAERVQWMKDNDVRIGLSFDGQPWSQNKSRPMVNGKPSFDQLLRGIDLLQRAGMSFGALVVLNRSNIDSVEDLLDFLLDNDIRYFKLNPISYLGAAQDNWDTLGLTQDEIIDYFKTLIDILVARGFPLMESNLSTMLDFLTSKQRSTRCMRSHCGAGDSFQAISAAGDIYPCGRTTQTPAMKLGNVMDPSVSSLSAPARGHALTDAIRARRPTDMDECNRCPYREFCQAGCSAQAYETYGTVRHRTPECAFFKTLYPHLMRRLCFDPAAFEAFRRGGYFGGDGQLTHVDYYDA